MGDLPAAATMVATEAMELLLELVATAALELQLVPVAMVAMEPQLVPVATVAMELHLVPVATVAMEVQLVLVVTTAALAVTLEPVRRTLSHLRRSPCRISRVSATLSGGRFRARITLSFRLRCPRPLSRPRRHPRHRQCRMPRSSRRFNLQSVSETLTRRHLRRRRCLTSHRRASLAAAPMAQAPGMALPQACRKAAFTVAQPSLHTVHPWVALTAVAAVAMEATEATEATVTSAATEPALVGATVVVRVAATAVASVAATTVRTSTW
mmetsp:Transcript_49103/g.130025  ORF Transcript_49103/g.130025 Transcript_49103/m.130025 type:complete len:268 (+) Transcript_49103:57-860(+)